MKQTWKKLSSLFLALACMVTLFAVPVNGAIDENLKSSIVRSLQSMVAMMANYSEEEMLTQIESADSVFLNSMVEQYYDAVEEAGAFQEVTASDIVVDEEKQVATVTLKVAFEKYNGEITAVCKYEGSNSSSFDDIWSAFSLDMDYPISALLKNAGLNTVMGVGIVFIVLIFLAFVIYLLRYANKGGSEEEPKGESASLEPVTESIVLPVVEVPDVDEEVELAIVLATAIAAYEEENTSGDGYVVRSIKKHQNKKWRRV